MNGFRDTEDKKDCTSCKYFNSWHSLCDGDPMEPTRRGECDNDKNEDLDESFGEGNICYLYWKVGK